MHVAKADCQSRMRFVVSFASLDRAKLGENARLRRGAVLGQAL